MKTKHARIVGAVKNSEGRFFGLGFNTAKGKRVVNAQFVKETPRNVLVKETKTGRERLLRKDSLCSFSCGAESL